jgi:hypothetical protein
MPTNDLTTLRAWAKKNGLDMREKAFDRTEQGVRFSVTDENGYVAELWIVDARLVEAATMHGAYDGEDFLAMIS